MFEKYAHICTDGPESDDYKRFKGTK